MNGEDFVIRFVTGITETIYALSAKEAMIIAQASQIDEGNDYRVASVHRYDTKLKDWVKVEVTE